MANEETKVFGALIQGYLGACLNLNIVAGKKIMDFQTQIQTTGWYPLSRWVELERTVLQSYKNANAILVRVGMEMMKAWYNFGPGKTLINRGSDFLHYQTGSGGYESVIKGPKKQVGSFELVKMDGRKGFATVHSTTPFNRNMECGVLIGGMLAPGDLDYVDVTNSKDPDTLEIEFH
ncbi:MAG: hypothetical protein JW969_03525 [Spirochaetales bacterium]|nr:hypothetical protein [Spirochaetales bacterium]